MTLHPEVKIGHVHLTVGNLERSLAFYRDILGFTVTAHYGSAAVFLSAGGYHHHIALNTWAGGVGPQQPMNTAGLYHFAILFPTRRELAEVLKRIMAADYPLEGTADHGVSESIYVRDPDNIGVELYYDKPRESWKFDDTGHVQMVTERLDTTSLLQELDDSE